MTDGPGCDIDVLACRWTQWQRLDCVSVDGDGRVFALADEMKKRESTRPGYVEQTHGQGLSMTPVRIVRPSMLSRLKRHYMWISCSWACEKKCFYFSVPIHFLSKMANPLTCIRDMVVTATLLGALGKELVWSRTNTGRHRRCTQGRPSPAVLGLVHICSGASSPCRARPLGAQVAGGPWCCPIDWAASPGSARPLGLRRLRASPLGARP